MVIAVSGITGFWPVLGVCAAGVLWTLYLFRRELASLTIDVAPNERNQRPFWLLLPGIAVLLFALYPFVHLYETVQNHIAPLGFEDLLQSYIHDRSLYVFDLAHEGIIVHDKTFERITLVGPAVVAILSDNDIRDSKYIIDGAPLEAMFLEVVRHQIGMGAIGFRNCIFKQVTFERIQFVGDKEAKAQFFNGLQAINGQTVTAALRQQLISGAKGKP
jgi:hypothetical protein